MQRILILIAANLFLASCSTTQHYSTATISATSELCNTQQTSAEIFRNGEKVIVEYDKKDSEDTTIIRPTFDTNKIDGDYDYYSRFDGA